MILTWYTSSLATVYNFQTALSASTHCCNDCLCLHWEARNQNIDISSLQTIEGRTKQQQLGSSVINNDGHCHRVSLTKRDDLHPHHDEGRTATCYPFRVSWSLQRDDLHNKQKDSSREMQENQLPGAGGQGDDQGQHRLHASGHLPPVKRRFQSKNLNNKSQKDNSRESKEQLPGLGAQVEDQGPHRL